MTKSNFLGTIFIFILSFFQVNSYAQNIFTYGNTPVSKSEFLRMYTKNTLAGKADMSEKAIREYVSLYSRFKMKVAEAEAAQIDTLPNIKSELDNYRKQLAKGYLTDKEVTNGLTKEAHDRLKKEIRIAHIMLSVPKGSTDTMRFVKMIDSYYTAINTGKIDFESLAKIASNDKATAAKGGDIGFITALQTPYEFETVAYNTTLNTVSKPFRTSFGYHILKKTEERISRGEVVVAQIMIGVKKSDGEKGKASAKQKADSILMQLKKGVQWNDLVKLSDDKYSVSNNGELQPFGVGSMTSDFENASFALKNPGDLSVPIFTEYGYHIIKLIKKNTVKPFDSMKNELSKKVERDGRMESARLAFLNKIRTKGSFKEMPNALNNFITFIPDTAVKNGYLTMPERMKANEPLFLIKNKVFDFQTFYQYIMQSSRGRLYGDKASTLKTVYNTYVEKSLMDFEEENLDNDNVEFKNLLKEYRDGIILFELTDKSVWTKASTDSTGLAEFYDRTKQKYQWGPSFEGRIIRVSNSQDATELEELLATYSLDTILVKMPGRASAEEGKFEYEKFDKSIALIQEGNISKFYPSKEGGGSVYEINKISLNPSQKSLMDARGYVIADYQDFLEKQWIANMEAKYPVKVNDAVLKSMVSAISGPKNKK